MQDCGFVAENNWFRYRAGAIIMKDNKMLFVKCNIGDYFYIIGGGVHTGETSEKCVEREVFEEASIKVKAKRLAVVCENFFKGNGGAIDGLDCHTIEFYYLCEIEDLSTYKNKTDLGEELVWIPIDEIPNNEIKPAFIKNRIGEIVEKNEIIHIIWENDR